MLSGAAARLGLFPAIATYFIDHTEHILQKLSTPYSTTLPTLSPILRQLEPSDPCLARCYPTTANRHLYSPAHRFLSRLQHMPAPAQRVRLLRGVHA